MQAVKIPIKYIDTRKYKVRVMADEASEAPTEWGNYDIVTFGRGRLVTDTDISEYLTEAGKLKPSLQAKLKAGTAFWIDIYEHSGMSYSLSGEGQQDYFDTANRAGLILFTKEYAKGSNYKQREAMARQDLRTYTQWANGDVYGASIETEAGQDVDSLWGLYGLEGVREYIAETIPGAEYTAVMQYSQSGPSEQELNL